MGCLHIYREAATFLKDREIIRSTAKNDAFLGSERQVHVILLEKTKGLVRLHYDPVKFLEQGGFNPNNPEYVRNGFLPHSTVQKHTRLHEGDVVRFDKIALIDMFPNEDPYRRKILKVINLHD